MPYIIVTLYIIEYIRSLTIFVQFYPEDHRISVMSIPKLSERAESGLHDLKVVILAWKMKNVLGSQKSLKIRTWKHYSILHVEKIISEAWRHPAK